MIATAFIAAFHLAVSAAAPSSFPFALTDDEVRAAAVVDEGMLAETVRTLSVLPSRVPGYGHTRTAANYVRSGFEAAGLMDIQELPFAVTVPVQQHAELVLPPASSAPGAPSLVVPLHAFWPNLVRTATTPPEGITGPFFYGGNGTLAELKGRQVEGSIVVLEYNSGRNWLNVPALGSRAVVFIEPEQTSQGSAPTNHSESAAKFLRTPVNVPRFLISRPDWSRVQEATAGRNEKPLRCTVRCRVDWTATEEVNIVGWVKGTGLGLPPEWRTDPGTVVLSAYYDSMSVTPTLAPGAEQACGMAALLDLARYFAAHPPPRAILFLATSGHGLFMEGVTAFLDRQMTDLGVKPATFIALDLASSSAKVGAYNVGHAYWDAYLSQSLSYLFAPVGDQLNRIAHRTALLTGRYSEKDYAEKGMERNPFLSPFIETLTGSSLAKAGVAWGYTLPTGMVHEAETALLFGHLSYAFLTFGADRPLVDSPFDTFDHVNLGNLAAQIRFLKPMLKEMLHTTDPVRGFAIRVDQLVDWRRQGHRAKVFQPSGTNAGIVSGRVVEFVPKKNYIPDEPKNDAVVIVRREYANTYLGVRCEPTQRVSTVLRDGREIEAHFRFPNIGRAIPGWFTDRVRQIDAFVLDPDTGEIVYAKDQGRNGELTYPTTVFSQTTPQEVTRTVVVFPCYPVDLFDLFDPRYMQILSEIRLLDAETDSEPESFGLAGAPPCAASGPEPGGNTYYDPCAALFIQRRPNRSHTFKVLGAAGIFGQRLTLLNASDETPTGKGFDAAAGPIFNTAILAARDMRHLNAMRIQELTRTGILSDPAGQNPSLVVELHRRSEEYLARAEDAHKREDYETFLHDARSAWAFGSRAYPLVLGAGKDAVLCVLFYLALLLPAAFFIEKLLFGYPDIKRQMLARAGIFATVFLLLRFVNPAFKLTVNPYVVLLGFVMIALTAAVLHVIFKMFQSELKRLRERVTGIHNVEIGRSDAAGVAFGLGISSMRKRKVRTANTLITLVMLTFSVLSFTSVASRNVLKGRELYDQRFTRIRAPYSGVLFRTPLYDPISRDTYDYVVREFAEAKTIAPRAWFPGGIAPTNAMVRVDSTAGKSIGVPSVLGLSPQEETIALRASGGERSSLWLQGRWFTEEDRSAAILSEALAKQLGLNREDIGKATLTIWERPFILRGILSDDFFSREKGFTDIDGEPLPPINYAMSMQSYQEVRSTRPEIVAKRPPPTFTHFGAETTLIVPFETALELGGNTRSIAIVSDGAPGAAHAISVKSLRDEVLNKMATGLFAAIDGWSYWYTSLGHADYKGLLALSVLILISGLIVFNTVLGSLYERQREIGIYTSLGLAPSHIGAFFLAESCVYAVLGTLFGYILGQVVAGAKVQFALPLLDSLALNYSSRSALYASFIVSAVVMLSSLYPAWKASRLSVPELERTVQLPKPEPDPATNLLTMTLDFPFTFTHEAAIGILAFVYRYFKEQEELATGPFHAQDIRFRSDEDDHVEVRVLAVEATVWLAPFDWGISQTVELKTAEMDGNPLLVLVLRRINGEVQAWQRVNRPFVAALRRRLLLWRAMAPADRARYVDHGKTLLVDSSALMPSSSSTSEDSE